MDLKEVGCHDRNWMDLAQDRDQWRAYVRAVMNFKGQLLSVALALFILALRVWWT